jgi:murein L,D-transpeptidase YcbB/YkuD
MLDAAKWAESDLLFTAAFIKIVKDVKRGRLAADSILKRDNLLSPEFFHKQWQSYGGGMQQLALSLESKQPRYTELKEALQVFLQNATFRNYTYINPKDSMHLQQAVAMRLSQEDSITFSTIHIDSIELAAAIKKYQSQKGLKETGKLTSGLIINLNNTDNYKFARISVNLDRYKGLQTLPQQYIWVNIPSYQLQLWDSGVVMLTSKVVVGKPQTRTPQLTSAISDLITYPKWHIPQSIIKNEILPALKRDPGYLARKGFSLVDGEGNEVDAYSVSWAKYENAIPYTVVQGSGDDNALGVIKFNFPNKHAVYLHDTNQRYLFSKEKRALSHGCVRVEAWEELANYILERDAAASPNAVPVDSMYTWLALKEKHLIPVRKRLPVFIRYFTCDVQDGKLTFYDDVYDEDRRLSNEFFKYK